MQAGNGRFDQGGVVREHADELRRMGEYDDPGDHVVGKGRRDHEADGLLDPVVIPGAVIVTHYGDGGLIDAADRLADDLAHGIDDGERADVQRAGGATERLQRQVDDSLRHAVGELEHKARHAQLQDAGHLQHVEMQPAYGEQGLVSGQKTDDPDGTDELGDDSGDRRALDAHVQHEDEQGVQRDVQSGADDDGAHADPRKAHAVDEGVHAEADEHEDGAGDVDAEIFQSEGQRFRIPSHGSQKGPCEDEKDGCQQGAEDQQHRESRLQDALRPGVVALAARDGAQGIAACAAQVCECRDQGNEGKGDADAGQRRRADAGDVSDEDAVHNVVEHVDDLGQRDGDTEP